ncbi:MAG: hypothetical protein JNL70_00235 [Saprospiraceae bacterium]|nr:hypothetical protein [Saprospiraceae bacterium]
MNKLLFPNGGLPLYGNDFDFMQSGLHEGINAVLRPFAEQVSGNMIVSGLDFTLVGSNYHISDGWVMLNYELLKFVGGDTGITDPVDLQDGVVVELYVFQDSSPNATRTMANGSTENVWQRRQARLAVVGGLPSLTVSDSIRLEYLLSIAIEGIADVSVPMIDFENSWTGSGLFSNRIIRRGKTVILRGLLSVGTIDDAVFTQIFTIQEGFRPKVRQYFICAMPNTSIALVDITTSGNVLVIGVQLSISSPPSLLDLSNIRYETA